MIDPVRKLCGEYLIDFDALPMVELPQCRIVLSQIVAPVMQSTLNGRCCLIVGFLGVEEMGVMVISSDGDKLTNWRGVARKVGGCAMLSIFKLQDPHLEESISAEEGILFLEKFKEREFDELQWGIHPQYKLAALGSGEI